MTLNNLLPFRTNFLSGRELTGISGYKSKNPSVSAASVPPAINLCRYVKWYVYAYINQFKIGV